MSLLLELEKNDKKGLFKSDDTYVNYSTGIIPLDYANGFWQSVKQPDGSIKHFPVPGIMGGSLGMIIGYTGSGKTTLADQIGYNIIRHFSDSTMHHVDAELTLLRERIMRTCGLSMENDDPRVKLVKENSNIDNTLDMINKIAEIKDSNGDIFMYEVKNKTFDGRTFKVYFPTVFIIDSVPKFHSKDLVTDDLGNNMAAAHHAKDMTRFVTNILQTCLKYNITVLFVNHIKDKIVANQYAPPTTGIAMLKHTEDLPGGKDLQFSVQNCFRLNNMTKSNLYTMEDDGFEGFKNTIQIAKTKSNFVGKTLPLSFNSDFGYDPIYSLFEFGDMCGLLEGNKNNKRFKSMENIKFHQKDFREKFARDKDFRDQLMMTLIPYLEAFLGEKEISKDNQIPYGEFMDMSQYYE